MTILPSAMFSSMPRYFALLRGIDAGGHRIKMDCLRELNEALGYEVTTLIRSQSEIEGIAAFEPRDSAPPPSCFPANAGSL